jgi:hypothetical protein
MQSVASGRQDLREKFYGYSAHDGCLAGLLAALGNRPTVFPQYSTLVLLELHYMPGGDHNVKVGAGIEIYELGYPKDFFQLLYLNETDSSTLWRLEIMDCGSQCGLERLVQLTNAIVPSNWELECGLYAWYHLNNLYTGTPIAAIIAYQSRIRRTLKLSNHHRHIDDFLSCTHG